MSPKEGSLIQRNLDVALKIEDRALYIALHRLEERGWLVASWGASENNRRARYYRLSASGRGALARKQREWSAHAAAMYRALGVKP